MLIIFSTCIAAFYFILLPLCVQQQQEDEAISLSYQNEVLISAMEDSLHEKIKHIYIVLWHIIIVISLAKGGE